MKATMMFLPGMAENCRYHIETMQSAIQCLVPCSNVLMQFISWEFSNILLLSPEGQEEPFMAKMIASITYEINFTKYFYKYKPLRSLEEITQDLLKLEEESEGLLREILK